VRSISNISFISLIFFPIFGEEGFLSKNTDFVITQKNFGKMWGKLKLNLNKLGLV
jgi:hypothetical protein